MFLPEARENGFQEREVEAVCVVVKDRREEHLPSADRLRLLLAVLRLQVVVETPEDAVHVDAKLGCDSRNVDRYENRRKFASILDMALVLISMPRPDRPEKLEVCRRTLPDAR